MARFHAHSAVPAAELDRLPQWGVRRERSRRDPGSRRRRDGRV